MRFRKKKGSLSGSTKAFIKTSLKHLMYTEPRRRTYRHLKQVLDQHEDLTVTCATIEYEREDRDRRSREMLCLQGLVVITLRDEDYRLPIRLALHPDYPNQAPFIFVNESDQLRLTSGIKHKLYDYLLLPKLVNWHPAHCDLKILLPYVLECLSNRRIYAVLDFATDSANTLTKDKIESEYAEPKTIYSTLNTPNDETEVKTALLRQDSEPKYAVVTPVQFRDKVKPVETPPTASTGYVKVEVTGLVGDENEPVDRTGSVVLHLRTDSVDEFVSLDSEKREKERNIDNDSATVVESAMNHSPVIAYHDTSVSLGGGDVTYERYVDKRTKQVRFAPTVDASSQTSNLELNEVKQEIVEPDNNNDIDAINRNFKSETESETESETVPSKSDNVIIPRLSEEIIADSGYISRNGFVSENEGRSMRDVEVVYLSNAELNEKVPANGGLTCVVVHSYPRGETAKHLKNLLNPARIVSLEKKGNVEFVSGGSPPRSNVLLDMNGSISAAGSMKATGPSNHNMRRSMNQPISVM